MTFIGHSHLCKAFALGNGEVNDVVAQKFGFRRGYKYLISVGSVGQPRDYDNRACFVVCDTDARTVEYLRVEYDIESAARRSSRPSSRRTSAAPLPGRLTRDPLRCARAGRSCWPSLGLAARKEPSPEFTRASERFNKLYAKELDDAYLDPAMREVEALLEKVPPDSLDAAAAAQLLSRIRENRARLDAGLEGARDGAGRGRTPPTLLRPLGEPAPDAARSGPATCCGRRPPMPVLRLRPAPG